MQDLNYMLYFAEVVDRGGFAAAGRALGIPKSRLSRRVAELEARLRQAGTVGDILDNASKELSRQSHHIGFALTTSA